MRHVTIELTHAQEALLSERLAGSSYASIDEFASALIKEEVGFEMDGALEAMLLEELEGADVRSRPSSGTSREGTPA